MSNLIDKNNPIISLCIPTNGISEWVFPVLNSIYNQDIDYSQFEVIVTDNGNNESFQNEIMEYGRNHTNMVYKKNSSKMFFNQLEALKLASGEYLKFINHRSPLVDGALEKMIQIIKENMNHKPTLYFSNGSLRKNYIECKSFDEFVFELGIYASWTTGVGVWNNEFNRVKDNLIIDSISPHSCILFSNRNDEIYKIYNFVFSKEITNDHTQKGSYDLFKAFGVEELSITLKLFIDGCITSKTFKKVKNDYKHFLMQLYYDFCILKKPCSYDLLGFDDAMGIFYGKLSIIIGAYFWGVKNFMRKIFKKNS